MFLSGKPTPLVAVLAGATQPPVSQTALTGYDGDTLARAAPPPPPAGTLTITSFNSPGDPPVGIEANNAHRFLNATGGAGLLPVFIDGVFKYLVDPP